MKFKPVFEFNKEDITFGVALQRENESKKYIRECRTIVYRFGIFLLFFAIGFEITLKGGVDNE